MQLHRHVLNTTLFAAWREPSRNQRWDCFRSKRPIRVRLAKKRVEPPVPYSQTVILGSSKVVEKIDRRIGEPRQLQVQWSFAVDEIVRDGTRDVLRIQREIGDHARYFTGIVPRMNIIPEGCYRAELRFAW